jgi:hypothetical protein
MLRNAAVAAGLAERAKRRAIGETLEYCIIIDVILNIKQEEYTKKKKKYII